MAEVEKKNLVPVLIAQATAFPQGRMQGVVLQRNRSRSDIY